MSTEEISRKGQSNLTDSAYQENWGASRESEWEYEAEDIER